MTSRHLAIAALVLLCSGGGGRAQQPEQAATNGPVVGRSVVVTTFGIVAASQPLAAQAGVQILARGGHAVDAAIAANAVLGVVEPEMNGIGGDLFAIVSPAANTTLHGLNASGWAPSSASAARLAAAGFREMPLEGVHSITV